MLRANRGSWEESMTPTDPASMSAEELLAHYARRALSPTEVLQAVTERIARLNPELNAFAVMNPASLAAAGESEARWRAGRPRGLLDGVPVTVKDLIDLAGFPTRRGSRLTDPAPVADDAPAVVGLKEQGAVIIGKTTTTEFGWKSPGDCPLHGITRNPWNKLHTPGGSSAGAAAAAAAGFGPLHLGTDGGGSIRIPAAWCGVVGLKPSFGRVPQWPLGAFAPVAVAGPLTRTVRDAALMLSAIARFDLRDPFCLPPEAHGERDWRDGIEDGVAEMRVAVLRHPGFEAPVDWEGIAAVEQAAQLLMRGRRRGGGGRSGSARHQRDFLPRSGAWRWRGWCTRFPETRRHMLDPGLLAVAAAYADVPASAMMEAEAQRIAAAHAMAAAAPALRPRAVPDRARAGAAGGCAARRPDRGAVDGLGALDLRLQPDPPARHRRADGLRRQRAAALGADRRRALPRRPGAAGGPHAGSGAALQHARDAWMIHGGIS